MTRLLLALVLCSLAVCARAAAPLENALRNHPSPYLAMHAGDPLAWQDWGQVAVERARREGKLLFLSIGYFSCHWCHVMQRESFRNAEIARYVNEHFIPVKIDRELEPALDARLLEFAERTRGQGGWPLNVFLTPDGHPLYAVLYEPPAEFLGHLRKLQQLWSREAASLRELARRESGRAKGPGEPQVDGAQARGYARKAAAGALALADMMHGGFGEQSKFPSVPQLEFLLALVPGDKTGKLREFLTLTLDQMAQGALYDHLGGGFFRYTVDPAWRTPHFEKMLYDNALLARLYLRAARALERPSYETVARATLDFMRRELRAPGGGYIAALSALDEKDVEGGYYLWRASELETLLEAAALGVFRFAYGMVDAPPFDAGYLPYRARSDAEVVKEFGLAPVAVEPLLAQARTKLLAARQSRALPRDTKQLAGWNGLALSAFAEAAAITGEAAYREVARELKKFLLDTLWDGAVLRRSVTAGRAVGAVALEDYAYVTEGLLAWAKLTGEEADFRGALAVAESAWPRFYGSRGWRLDEGAVIAAGPGQDVINDGPLPSPAAVLARASLELAARLKSEKLRARALGALNSGHAQLADDPFWHATHIGAMLAAR